MNVKSTYNFVPAPTEEEVYKPEWANQVSHDIPFSDGESGEIEIKITAQTPIFIRNGHKKDAPENEFSHYVDEDGKKVYFIPGSSLKGMFRNVLEIMSFSRMNKNLVNDDRYSYRDLSNANNLYMTNYKKFKIQAGWLIEKLDGTWEIEECADLAFIHHEELLKIGIPFRNLFLGNNPKEKTAKYKYGIVDSKSLNGNFTTYTKKLFGNVERNMASYNSQGQLGTLVFSGQSGKRNESNDPNKKSSGKVHEFVFFDSDTPNKIEVTEKMQRDFKFIYYDNDKSNISADWKYWRDNFLDKNKKVPVFFAKNEKGELYHFGLSYMYKLPYKNSVHEIFPLSKYKNEQSDLATTIFGVTNKNDSFSLKGRVMIGHAIAINNRENLNEVKEILGGPKASYFPFYLEQDNKNGQLKRYNTFEDNATLRGYKRYPTHSMVSSGVYDDKQLKNDNVFSKFIPLNTGSIFVSKVRFFNLKKAEVGALIAAITFNSNQQCSHSIGAAKPFGYGRIKVDISDIKFLSFEKEHYIESFRSIMRGKIQNWDKSAQLNELMKMASNNNDIYLQYPSISEFVEMKNYKEQLYRFSEIAVTDKKPEIIRQIEISEAIVTVAKGALYQAKLIEGKDQNSKKLEIPSNLTKSKPKKTGEKIKVKIIYNKGGNIEKLEFMSKS